jgi:ABC-2 type transport system ATP-binding protein
VEQVCDRVAVLQRGRLVHLQAMSKLLEGRLVKVRFGGPAPPLPPLPELQVRESKADRMELEYTGPLPELLKWLAGENVLELTMEPLGLNAIYYRYHGKAE